MREELRRFNSVGNKEGISLFCRALFKDGTESIDAFMRLCDLEPSAQLNSKVSILLFEEFGILKAGKTKVSLTEDGKSLKVLALSQILRRIVEKCISYSLEEGIIHQDSIKFDPATKRIIIKRGAFPLSAAVLRNFLITISAITINANSDMDISEDYQDYFEATLQEKRIKLTQEELLEKLRLQEENGKDAELFVLKLETERLDTNHKPKRISQIDVTAGYDIVSFKSNSSSDYDLFIEVKSYVGNPKFFWTKNERNVASTLRGKYSIYLVSTEKSKTDPLYKPEIINDPVSSLDDDSWLIEPDSFSITKL